MKKPFQFKQFTIHQDRCAMKVGTDGVLLGAWTCLEHRPNSILDIGAGTGLISLMLAQRSVSETIDAIEIDTKAYEQCVENFEASSWADRLFCYHAGWDEFVTEMEHRYDLIVSNPPYFSPPSGEMPKAEGENSMDESRKAARFYDALPFGELLEGVSKLLSNDGFFSIIIPFKEEDRFVQLAATYNLFPKRITRVKGKPSSEIKRSLLELSFRKTDVFHGELTLELERHQYTEAYIDLTKDFYLKMQQWWLVLLYFFDYL